MAYTYNNIPVLSKVKIGETIYYLKDAEVRTLLDTFGNAVTYNVDTAVTDGSANLITSGAVHQYVNDRVVELTGGAMTFLGIKDELPATGNPGEVVIVGTAEYVYADGKWNLYGDEGIYATIQGVEDVYVKKTLTIAGIDLQDAITADELQTALGLGALAYKDSASGSVNAVTGVAAATYTPAGTVEVKTNSAVATVDSAGTYTPAGTVAGNVTAAGQVTLARDENGVAVSGTVSAPNITVTPITASVQHIDSLGSLPSYTGAQYTAPSVNETTQSFANEGVVAAIDEADAEMLVFTAATKANALTGTGFNAGSYTPAEFNAGSLPTLGAAQTVVTGIEKAEASVPVFTGDKLGATFTGVQTAINAEFAGTEGNISVSGSYDKVGVESATFTGTEAEITHEVTKENISVTVS